MSKSSDFGEEANHRPYLGIFDGIFIIADSGDCTNFASNSVNNDRSAYADMACRSFAIYKLNKLSFYSDTHGRNFICAVHMCVSERLTQGRCPAMQRPGIEPATIASPAF